MANNFANAQDLVAVEDIVDGTVFLKSGALRQIAMVGGINFSLKSQGEQNVITQAYQNFLNGLNFPLQIIIHSRKINIAGYLETLEARKDGEAAPLLQSQISEYQEFIKGFVHDNAIMAKTFFVVIPFSPVSVPSKGMFMKLLPFGDKKKEADRAAQAKTTSRAESVSQLKQRTAQVVEGLAALGLEAVVLADEALVELFYNFYNPETTEKKDVAIAK
jgi:type IV secretory pathway VirB4 component